MNRLFVAFMLVGLPIVALGCSDPEPTLPKSKILRVVSSSPQDGGQNIPVQVTVRLDLDGGVNQALVDAGEFYVSPVVAGKWTASEDGKSIVFTPDADLEEGQTYRFGATKLSAKGGATLTEPFTLEFTTLKHSKRNYKFGDDTVSVAFDAREDGLFQYTLQTTADLRDNEPADKQITFVEQPGQMIVRTGDVLFDALFSMAMEEVRQNAVESISDGAFNNGQGVACDCFETGAKWNYVWTRDTAYAVDLGLAFVNPERALNSLMFKLSPLKAGGGTQIVQDTGSGGSYPVSTDRVVWAIGAARMLSYIDPAALSDARATQIYEAIINTIAQDREMVFDARDGLYRGEQSFLDWREQSYAARTRDNTAELGMSKSLSTNVGHYVLLDLAAKLSKKRNQPSESYEMWAQSLKQAIQKELWLAEQGMFSTFKLYDVPTKKFDLLGQSLAVLYGVATDEQAKLAVANYPHVANGPPVLWPQQPLIPIYHNRGNWPFVTAYGLLAAKKVGNDAVFENNLASLFRGAALNLSNMENFEFVSQKPWVDDGDYSGPVVNSRRQLWSVAGYIGAIVRGVFGFQASGDGFVIAPFITKSLHETYWKGQTQLALNNLKVQNKVVDLVVNLPTDAVAGQYQVESITFNDMPLTGNAVLPSMLKMTNTLVVNMVAGSTQDSAKITLVESEDFRAFWSPKDAAIMSTNLDADNVTLTLDNGGEEGVLFNIYEDGKRVGSGIDGTQWQGALNGQRRCYVVESYFPTSKNHGHLSEPKCVGPQAADLRLSAFDMAVVSGDAKWSTQHGRAHYQDYGAPEDVLEIQNVRVKADGQYNVRATYGNGAGSINTGITAAAKWLVVSPNDDPTNVQRVLLVMPHLADWSRWAQSTAVLVSLKADKTYTVRIEDAINMSYFSHFEPYTGGLGGGADVYNNVNIHDLYFKAIDVPSTYTLNAKTLDGQDDFGKFDATQHVAVGAKGQDWESFALDWDAHYFYGAVVSESFEDPYKPLMLYMESASTLSQAQPSAGIEYSNQTAALPFDANTALTFRALSDDGTGLPYNGLWRKVAGKWEQVRRFEQGVHWWLSADKHTISYRLPRAWFGEGKNMRMTGHVVHGQVDAQWRGTVPAGATPWQAGGAYYELSLDDRLVSSWSVR